MKKIIACFFFISFFYALVASASGDFAFPRSKNVVDLKSLPDGRYPITYPNGINEWPIVQRRLLPNGKKTFTVLFVLWHLDFVTETADAILAEVEAHEIEWRDNRKNLDIKASHLEIKNGKVIYWHPNAKERSEFYCIYSLIAGKKDCK